MGKMNFEEAMSKLEDIAAELEKGDLNLELSVSKFEEGMMILNSIKYNDLVIEKYIADNDLESSETIYKIPEPENKKTNKNILEYIDEEEKEKTTEEDTSDSM